MGGAISTTFFATDLTALINDLWQTVTGLGSNPVSASVTDLATSSELDFGGDVYRITQSVVVCAGAISSPVVGSLATVNGTERMIAGYSLSPDSLSYTIELAEVTT